MIQAGLFPILPRLLLLFLEPELSHRNVRLQKLPLHDYALRDLHSHGRGFLFHGHALRDYGHALRGRDYVLPPFHDRVLRDHDPIYLSLIHI